MIWSLAFWKGAAERAIKTAAQVLAAVFVVGVPILDVDIVGALGLVATAVVASLLTSILSADFVAGVPDAVAEAVAANISSYQASLPSLSSPLPPVTRSDMIDLVPPMEPGGELNPRAAARAAKIARLAAARGDG